MTSPPPASIPGTSSGPVTSTSRSVTRCRALTTQIYFEGDPYIDSDVVGAVKDSLVIDLVRNGVADTRCSYDFVLTPSDNV